MERMSEELMPEAWVAKEAEESVIASCLLDPMMLDKLAGKLSRRDFFDTALGELYEFIVEMHAAGDPVGDTTLLYQKLRGAKFLPKIGGIGGLGKLATSAQSAAHAEYYASLVRDAADRRRLSAIASQFYESLSDPQVSPSDAIRTLEGRMLATGYRATVDPVGIGQAYDRMIERIFEARKRENDVGVQTGLANVDATTGGLFPGELCVCAARPSMGKTAIGFQIAEYAAEQGRPVLFVSLETEDWELAARSAAAASHKYGDGKDINGAEIRAAKYLSDDQIALLQAMARMKKDVPLKIWRPTRTTVAGIRSQAKMLAATSGLALLAVDYLQLIDPADSRALRHEQLSQIGKDLKRLANELDIPVLALAQINRKGEGEKPKLSQLEGSGSLEQDANTVWLVHREDRAASDAVLMIEKNRSGSTGDLELMYDCPRTVFYDPKDRKSHVGKYPDFGEPEGDYEFV